MTPEVRRRGAGRKRRVKAEARGGRLLRDRLLDGRVGLHLVVGWGVAMALLPRLSWAETPLDPAGVAAEGTAVAAAPLASSAAPGWPEAALPASPSGGPIRGERIGDDPAAARAGQEERIIRGRLRELGASPADAEAVIARLSPAERAEVASRASELAAGGSVAAPILAVAIIVGLLVILVLELIGRRVVSRPAT